MRKVFSAFLVFLASTVALTAVLGGCLALFIGPVLESGTFRRLAERSVRSLTGLSCRIERIRFEYPFALTARGISVEGRVAGGSAFSVYTGEARAVAGLGSLVRGRLDEIRAHGVEVYVEMTGAAYGGNEKEGFPSPREILPQSAFEVPEWAWRVRQAGFRASTVRVGTAGGSFCFEDLGISWACSVRTDDRAGTGTLRVSLGSGGEHPADLVLRFSPASIKVLSGPVALPPLDAAALTGLAGLEVPLTGTLSGAVFPVPGDTGAEALEVLLFADDLSLEGAEPLHTGFDQGSLRVGGTLLMPRNGSGLTAILEEVTASVAGMTVEGRPVGNGLQPIGLKGTLAYDTLTDSVDGTLHARDRENNLDIRAAGTLDGMRSGRPHGEGSLRAGCRDLGRLAKELGPGVSLPRGLTIGGDLFARAAVTGSLESTDLRGNLETSSLRIGLRPATSVPIRFDASFSGSLRKGSPERIALETTRCEIGEIPSPRVSLVFDPSGVAAEVSIDSADAQSLASLVGPVLPREIAGYGWGGTVDLSATARRENTPGSSTEGRFTARFRDGRFMSEDSQRMGEGVDLEVDGTFHLSEVLSSADLLLVASLARGEVVIGETYGDLAKTRPRLRTDLCVERQTRVLRLRSLDLTLDGVGTAGLTGRLYRHPAGTAGRLRLKAGPLDLEGLLDRVLRDGLGGRYPALETASAAGTLEIATDLDLAAKGSSRVQGDLLLKGVSLADPAQGLSVGKVEGSLPFSFVTRPEGKGAGPGPTRGAPTPPGTFTVEGIDFKGLEIPTLHARVSLADNCLTLEDPMRIDFAGGALHIEELVLEGLGLGMGQEKGRAILEMTGLDLAPVTRALAGRVVEGRLNGRFDRLAIEEGFWDVQGRLGLWIRGGELRVDGIELKGPASGIPSGRCEVRARGIPLEALSREFFEPPLKGTLDGELPTVELSGGKAHTTGSLTLSALGGEITLSGLKAGDLQKPKPFVQLDIRMKDIDLAQLTSPLEVGRVSGVLQGQILNLRVRPGFPYATAFQAGLETVRRRGVPRKIDARAVETISRMGGSNQLAAVLSRGLYRYFDEYYYSKMGLRATLQEGWLELHGIPKGDQEYLILRAFRIPTLSMPIAVLTPNQKIRFNRWLADLMRVGQRSE